MVEAKRLPPPVLRKELRKAAGLTLVDVAALVEVSKQSIWLWEAGRVEPRGANRLRYAQVLDQLNALI